MLSLLENGVYVTGLKQSQRAVTEQTAHLAFVAQDADERIKRDFTALCKQHSVQISVAPSMKELGAACKIEVGAAVAVLLRQE